VATTFSGPGRDFARGGVTGSFFRAGSTDAGSTARRISGAPDSGIGRLVGAGVGRPIATLPPRARMAISLTGSYCRTTLEPRAGGRESGDGFRFGLPAEICPAMAAAVGIAAQTPRAKLASFLMGRVERYVPAQAARLPVCSF
jgi:hypothetical protein